MGSVPFGPENIARNAPRGVTGVSSSRGGRTGVCGDDRGFTPAEGAGIGGENDLCSTGRGEGTEEEGAE